MTKVHAIPHRYIHVRRKDETIFLVSYSKYLRQLALLKSFRVFQFWSLPTIGTHLSALATHFCWSSDVICKWYKLWWTCCQLLQLFITRIWGAKALPALPCLPAIHVYLMHGVFISMPSWWMLHCSDEGHAQSWWRSAITKMLAYLSLSENEKQCMPKLLYHVTSICNDSNIYIVYKTCCFTCLCIYCTSWNIRRAKFSWLKTTFVLAK